MSITITKITLNGQNQCSFGAECSVADAVGYREWIAEQLAENYPGTEIEINEADSTHSVVVEIDDESDHSAAQGLKDDANVFCMDAWDRCPWNWVS